MLKNSWVAIGALCVAILGGCSGSSGTGGHGGHGGGTGGSGTGGGAHTGGHGGGSTGTTDGGVDRAFTGNGGHGGDGGGGTCQSGASKGLGQSCGCAAECASGFCADGFCCNKACTDGCLTCGEPGSEGTCISRSNGAKPRTAAACPTSAVSTCGLDGLCDGTGKCRDWPTGSVCTPGTCQGAALIGVGVCDGSGQCRPGPTMICAPFQCDPNKGACYDSCTSQAQCSDGHACDATGSCGKRMPGAKCAKNDDCLSGFCADNVCCNSACTGACVSCNLPDRAGVCWPIDMGAADPHNVCKDHGSSTCGQTGQCDGVGGCAMYALGTVCSEPTCTGDKLNTSAICDGLGSCKPPGLQTCFPFKCDVTSCTIFCNSDSDCDTGISCVGHSCGPKQDGQVCKAGTECKSGNCVDGYCCENSCTGACRSCGLPGSQGKCTMVSAGNADPRTTCKDMGAASCNTNGKCDGAGACQLYTKNTVCKSESCASNIYTPISTCDGAGKCVTPNTLACAPYVCNGSKCFISCTADTQCLTPNRCSANSCGPSSNGATCSSNSQCKSGFCAQGVCCNSACNGACQACNLSGSLGACTNVPTGSSDPAGMCKDQGAASCGTNGKCQAGACQKYANGTTCADATCPSGTTTFTGKSTCDGSGKCVKPGSSSCSPFLCGSGACKAACSSNSDCSSPNTCANSSCGLKDPGRTCSAGSECKSGFCSQGVCCSTNCNGTCKSCNVSAALAGTCSNVPSGQPDPTSTCKDQGAASCGTTGVCNGSGACQLYSAGTVCVGASCPTGSTMRTNARTCDGSGVCKTATTSSCGQFSCNGTTDCNTTCTMSSQCATGTSCDPMTNKCGKFVSQGNPCTTTLDCFSGLTCLDGICCASSSCGTCQACNVPGSQGTCANIPSGGAELHGKCPVSASMPCGNTGNCTGNGTCQQADTNTSCGMQMCSGSTLTLPANCNGNGSCAVAMTKPCDPYVCGGNACKTVCTSDNDCLSPNTCQGTTPKSCGLKPNGTACSGTTAAAANAQCTSGNCVDGVCCGDASCGACNKCNVSGHEGSCWATGSGTTDSRCAATTPCGRTTSCGGAGAAGGVCQTSTAMCAPAKCSGSNFIPAAFCSGTGTTCPSPTPVACGNLVCDASSTAGCRACTGNNDCGTNAICLSSGMCKSGGGFGDSCGTGAPCASGTCVDGVCCHSASCGTCETCNGSTPGTCTAVSAGDPEPHNLCASNGECGNTGNCAAGKKCQQVASGTACGKPASCSGGMQTSARACDGNGNCPDATVKSCDQYVCGGTSCKTMCMGDMDCIGGDYCDSNGNCQTKKALGKTCSATSECASGVCTDEHVCCSTACDSTMCLTCKDTTPAGMCTPVTSGSCASPPPPPPPMDAGMSM